MNSSNHQKINNILVDLFHNILEIEQVVLKREPFGDLSINEVHTIAAIGERGKGTMSQISSDLGITIGTLTVSVNNLLRKGYVVRHRSSEDRRIVLISLTEKGNVAFRMHRKFHYDLVNRAIKGISEEEKKILLRSLNNLNDFCLTRIKSIKSRKR